MGSFLLSKIFDKFRLKADLQILADRLVSFLQRLISPTQVGFVQGMSYVINKRRVLAALDGAKLHHSPALLTIDAEKAFESVDWGWLDIVFDWMGLNGSFRSFLSSLYSNARARIYTPGFLSQSFLLHKSTRQCCPLAPGCLILQ